MEDTNLMQSCNVQFATHSVFQESVIYSLCNVMYNLLQENFYLKRTYTMCWAGFLWQDEARKNSEKLKQELSEKETERIRINARAEELQKWLNQCEEGNANCDNAKM